MSIQSAGRNDPPARGKQLSVVPPAGLPARRSLVARTMDHVVPSRSRFFGLIWIVAILAILALFGNIQGAATQFYGIAEGRQQSISFQYPVEIVAVPVVEGQKVQRDAKLLQVRRYDLDVELAVIGEQINKIRAEQAAMRHNVSATIASLEAELGAGRETLNTRIQSLESKLRFNRALAQSIIGDQSLGAADEGPLLTQLNGLRAEQRQLDKLYRARIDLERQKLDDFSAPSEARIGELQQQENELRRQTEALVVNAAFSGSIGSVMHKPGEQVDAFSPIISIHGASTQSIKGYIHEAVINDIRIGQTVWIKPLGATSDQLLLRGVVESLGSRIVEYPERLKRSVLVSAWGREAVIRVDAENSILLGEKVSVMLQKPEPVLSGILAAFEDYLPISTVRAWFDSESAQRSVGPAPIEVQVEGLPAREIEASGIAWLPATNSWLLVSDEQSALFEMNAKGRITRMYALEAAAEINDAESISQDGTRVYVVASLAPNRAGELRTARRQLVRVQLDRQGLQSSEAIDLYAILLELGRSAQADVDLRDFIAAGVAGQGFEIEAHAVVNNALYLGFKAPLDADGNSVILKLDDVERLFAGDFAGASMWMKVNLEQGVTGVASRLSDMVMTDSALFLLSVGKQETQVHSFFWRYDYAGARLQLLAEYAGLRAEGLSIEPDGSIATIVFDGGGKQPSQILHRRMQVNESLG